MARVMLSEGMLASLAAAMAVRSRGLPVGSPPPPRAAIVISRIKRVKMRPRLASRAPFLCLMVLHFECPDMARSWILKGGVGRMLPQRSGGAPRGRRKSAREMERPAGPAACRPGGPDVYPGNVLLFHTVAR